jgi:KaiC/GvpD/RAD55 family RecA-like ATPase
MEKDKKRIINPDRTKIAEDEVTASNQPTMRSETGDMETTVRHQEETLGEKTSLLFGKEEIQRRIEDEAVEVPEIAPEDFQTDYISRLISKPFSNRTEQERLKINRNFLRDAEPLNLERLQEDVKNEASELATGFTSLDRWISIPNRQLTLIVSRPLHGKTTFMLNLLLNLCRMCPKHHFLYYTYGESRQDVEIKLINMCSEIPFSSREPDGFTTNFKRWQYEIRNRDIDYLIKKSETDPEYRGLKHFLDIASRVHVMDGNYHIVDLLDSIQAFKSTLPVGAVFIDYLQAIRPDKAFLALPRHQQVQAVTDQLIQVDKETMFPFILGAQLTAGDRNLPEYDGVGVAYVKDLQDPDQVSSLIIGLQNYAKSQFIGSHINDRFKSRFNQYVLKKAEKMPESFRDKHPNTVILAKVLVNRGGSTPEVELMFNKWLMKISDFSEEPPAKA